MFNLFPENPGEQGITFINYYIKEPYFSRRFKKDCFCLILLAPDCIGNKQVTMNYFKYVHRKFRYDTNTNVFYCENLLRSEGKTSFIHP